MDNQQFSWPGWETVRLIGQGSFGTVYEIQRQVFDETEKAALKVISIPQSKNDIEEMYSDGYDDESITSTFQSHLKSIVAEYSMTRKMSDCVNIVSCDDVRYVQHDDGIGWDIFIKMELLTPLTKALTSKVSEDAVIKLGLDMCSALEMCRKHDIIHRDIKPQNIFVSENGDYKLGDFGIAKTVERTSGGTKIGTYKYMAPEVYNNQPYGCSADIYSLGIVLYWLLNERRTPFLPLPPEKLKAGMEEDARRRRMSGELLPAPANGSEQLKAVVLRACAFDPKERYQTPLQMRQDLLAAERVWKIQNPALSGVRFCSACGAELTDDCLYCVYCGNPMDEEAAEQTAHIQTKCEENAKQEELIERKDDPQAPIDEIYILTDRKKVKIVKMKRCANCGASMMPDATVCPQCGVCEDHIAANEVNGKITEQQQTPAVQTVCEPQCPYCGAALPPDVRFCIQCGKPLAAELEQIGYPVPASVCPECGEPYGEEDHFCSQCGRRL